MSEKHVIFHKKHQISYKECLVSGAKFGVIIVHGFAEHSGRYAGFQNELSPKGISSFAVDLRGHGESGGKRGDAKNFKTLLSDLDILIYHIKSKHPSLKIVLFGHSFGGQISLVYSALHKTIDGLILSSPLLQTPKKYKYFKFLPYKILSFVKIKKKHSESSEMLNVSHNDPLACNKFSLRLTGILLHEGIKYVNKNISSLNCPVLVVAGKLDPLVNIDSTKRMFQKIGSKNKQLKIFINVKHRIVQNEGANERIAEIVSWINNKI